MNGNYLVTAFILIPAVRSLPPLSIPKIAHTEHYGKIDHQVLHPDDELSADLVNIQQGEASDCYFLSSEMAAAHRFPAIIKARLSDNGDGTYGGNFFGTPRGARGSFTARVNGDLPEDRHNKIVNNSVETVGGKRFSWTAISEKLWAAVNGNSYSDIDDIGDSGVDDTDISRALYAPTGKPVTSRDLSILAFAQFQVD
jgi:hypothetical protein